MPRAVFRSQPARTSGLMIALALLGACASVPESSSGESGESIIVLQPFEELSGVASDPSTSCKAGFRYVYSPALPPSQREVFYQTGRETASGTQLSSMGRAGGPLELPRPARDPRPTQRDDGMMVFEVGITTFGPCRRPRTGEPPVVEFTVGECVVGDCPPMRYEAPDSAELIIFRLVE